MSGREAGENVLLLGYRAKTARERTISPDDDVLIADDPEVQKDFERVIFSLFRGEEQEHDPKPGSNLIIRAG